MNNCNYRQELAAAAGDVERGIGSAGDAAVDFAEMLGRLETDPLANTPS
jgi:hypothetical protein